MLWKNTLRKLTQVIQVLISHIYHKGGYPREINCRQFGVRNCREKFCMRFHVKVKYVDNHCRRVSDSFLSAALESFLTVAYPFESKNYVHIYYQKSW